MLAWEGFFLPIEGLIDCHDDCADFSKLLVSRHGRGSCLLMGSN